MCNYLSIQIFNIVSSHLSNHGLCNNYKHKWSLIKPQKFWSGDLRQDHLLSLAANLRPLI
jgi:hypothetical protein